MPGGYGGPRPGDFGGCTYRPMGDLPPHTKPDHPGGCCAVPAMVLAVFLIGIIILF